MRVLLDTHCWLWMQANPERFCHTTYELLQSTENELLLSAASAWEIAIKVAIGKLSLPAPPEEYVPSRMAKSGTSALPIFHRHALHVAQHRLIIAQAQLEEIPVLTADRLFPQYDVELIAP
ncbi:MAG: type II toxin-antitoxin system VapC family toxin [Deltaproteobacteria bacterium]|nr:type II toxin-antitoxin system VapC family toxin [Deltaproteobacteria bacterium]